MLVFSYHMFKQFYCAAYNLWIRDTLYWVQLLHCGCFLISPTTGWFYYILKIDIFFLLKICQFEVIIIIFWLFDLINRFIFCQWPKRVILTSNILFAFCNKNYMVSLDVINIYWPCNPLTQPNCISNKGRCLVWFAAYHYDWS